MLGFRFIGAIFLCFQLILCPLGNPLLAQSGIPSSELLSGQVSAECAQLRVKFPGPTRFEKILKH